MRLALDSTLEYVDTGFGTNQLYSACRLTCTHHFPDDGIECNPPVTGTGFLVEFPSPDNRMGLVTNRHLVDAAFYDFANEGTVVKSIKLQLWQSSQLLLEHTITD